MSSNPSYNPNSARRCLVTGGAGFIGSHIVEQLIARQHEVVVVDNFSSGKRENLPSEVEVIEADLREGIGAILGKVKPEIVIHQAAQVSVSASMQDPIEDARMNILTSIQLIHDACRHDVQKIVYASSAAAYGPQDSIPLTESMRPVPVSPYGASKYTVEHYLKTAALGWGLREWVALRYGNVYGPRQDPHGEAGVVAIFIQKFLSGDRPTIFDDGEMTRDYIYVEDVARANVKAVETDLQNHSDPVFNISRQEETSVNKVFEILRDEMGSDMEAFYGPPRPGDVRRSILDSSSARDTLDWNPQVTVEEGLRKTLQSFLLSQR